MSEKDKSFDTEKASKRNEFTAGLYIKGAEYRPSHCEPGVQQLRIMQEGFDLRLQGLSTLSERPKIGSRVPHGADRDTTTSLGYGNLAIFCMNTSGREGGRPPCARPTAMVQA